MFTNAQANLDTKVRGSKLVCTRIWYPIISQEYAQKVHSMYRQRDLLPPSFTPLLIPHESIEACTTFGYVCINLQTWLMTNVCAIGKVPKTRDNLSKFNLDRLMKDKHSKIDSSRKTLNSYHSEHGEEFALAFANEQCHCTLCSCTFAPHISLITSNGIPKTWTCWRAQGSWHHE